MTPADRTQTSVRHIQNAPTPPTVGKEFRASIAKERPTRNTYGTRHRARKEFRKRRKELRPGMPRAQALAAVPTATNSAAGTNREPRIACPEPVWRALD